MKLNKFRAVFWAALFFLSIFFGHPLLAKPASTETYKDIIEKAHTLSLQNDRPQAIRILSSAVKKETRPQAVAELKRVMVDLSQVFLSDKSQQLFESALSLKKNEPSQALDKIQEALQVEPENSLIIAEFARIQIGRGECRSALDAVQKKLLVVVADEGLLLAKAQAAACLELWTEIEKMQADANFKNGPHAEFWLVLDVENQIQKKNHLKAQELLKQVQKIAPKYPEGYYWQQFLEQKINKSYGESAQKYVMSCKNISVALYRQYMIDPMLCRRIKQVEADLKGLHAKSE